MAMIVESYVPAWAYPTWMYEQKSADDMPEYFTYWHEPLDWYGVRPGTQKYWSDLEAGFAAVTKEGVFGKVVDTIPADLAVKGLVGQALPLQELRTVDFHSFMGRNWNVDGKALANNAAVICLADMLGVPDGAYYDKSQGQYVLSHDLKNALEVFQSKHGIEATGKLNYPTIELISGINTSTLLYENWTSK